MRDTECPIGFDKSLIQQLFLFVAHIRYEQ